jgi:hypothetical protein
MQHFFGEGRTSKMSSTRGKATIVDHRKYTLSFFKPKKIRHEMIY